MAMTGALAQHRPLLATARRSSTATRGGRSSAFVVRSAGLINDTIDKENPKVVNSVSINDIEKQAVYCRCWKSATFPLCNGAHMAHNKETGDNVGPLIVKKE